MSESKLLFQLSDRIDGVEVSPRSVPLSLLRQFSSDVGQFIAGSTRDIDPADLSVAVVEGSLGIAVPQASLPPALMADLASLDREDSLHLIDPRRADVIQRWQQQPRTSQARRYVIGLAGIKPFIVVSAESRYRVGSAEPWALTERYLLGKVMDMGGKSSANLHLQLADGKTVTVAATQEQIAAERENRVYHEALLRVEVEEHIRTGQFRNARLIHFAPYRPRFDSQAFEEMVRKGTEAWKGVDNPAAWVREQRGH